MGIFERLAAKFVPELDDIESGMAADPTAPTQLLRSMAEKEPRLWDTLLANPACPPDVAEWIRARNGISGG